MSSKAKVDSWVGKGSASAKRNANASDSDSDSDSDASSVASVVSDVPPKAAAAVDDDSDDSDDEAPTPDAGERELNIDWEVTLPKIRPALLDRSRKRREQFAQKFLYVTDEGESQCPCPVVVMRYDGNGDEDSS
jgi:hypothetical protein